MLHFRIVFITDHILVLLRIIEYFDGVMFLTTNRVEVIDRAFKSRIHLSIAYPDLTYTSRRLLWETFIIRASGQARPDWLNEEFLEGVAGIDINGREIKNAVRVAHALATHAQRTVMADDVRAVLRVLKSFDEDVQKLSAKRPVELDEEYVPEVAPKKPKTAHSNT